MKLKFAARVLSGARHLFDSEAKFYDRAGALIRLRSVSAARKCAQIGRNTDWQFHKCLKEFLAFISVLAVGEIALSAGKQQSADLTRIYESLRTAICEGHDADQTLSEHHLAISRLITYKNSGFDHWFYGYWNADFSGMRVSKRLLEQLSEAQVTAPSGDYASDAAVILLARITQSDGPRASMPGPELIEKYQSAIRDEIAAFKTDWTALTGQPREPREPT